MNTSTTCSPLATSTEYRTNPNGFTYVMYMILTLTAVASFLGNVMVIIIITRSTKLHNITWSLLLNLAVSDFLSASVLVPMVIGIQTPSGMDPEPWLCSLIGFTYTALAEASIWTLTLLSIDRYFAVNQPLHYHQRVTKPRAMVAICVLWLCAIVWGSIPFIVPSGYTLKSQYRMCLSDFSAVPSLAYIAIGICLPFVILCCMYVSIGRTAFTQAQRKVIECDEDNCRYVPPKHKDYRAVKILAILAGVFATCWLPFNITTIVDLFTLEPIPSMVCQLSLALTLMNAAINPWLYSVLNRTFRIAAVKQVRNLYRNVLHRLEDNKVRPPSNGADIELERSNFTKMNTPRSKHPRSQDANIVPLLPNQISEPQITASSNSLRLHRSLSGRASKNVTV